MPESKYIKKKYSCNVRLECTMLHVFMKKNGKDRLTYKAGNKMQ